MDEIKGVYIPFWLFDVDADAQITYEAEKVHSHTSGDTEYTTREIYSVYREGSLSFDHVPADGSRKMDDTLMEAIEPYNFQEAVPFQQAYLAGYLADRYDVNVDERIDRARDRIRVCTERAFVKLSEVITVVPQLKTVMYRFIMPVTGMPCIRYGF